MEDPKPEIKKIYLISGIGADHRVFQYLDFSGYQTTFIKWAPVEADESLSHYAKKLLTQIITQNPVLIGLSFGGIVAAEIAKLIPVSKIILIASVKSMYELPPFTRRSRLFPIYRFLPGWLLIKPNVVLNWLFGVKSKPDRLLLAAILADTDPDFLKWALDKITGWQNKQIHPSIVHIHGTADRLFPFKYVKCDVPVSGGGHFMTVNKAAELSRAIINALEA